MAEEKKQEKKKPEEADFVVRDRRMFTPQGELKEEYRQRVTRSPAPDAPAVSEVGAASAAAETAQERASESARKEFAKHDGPRNYRADFSTLIVSLATTTMYQLGLVRDPQGPAPPVDLDAARHTIDMLGVIEEKTRGNLSREEKQLVDQSLYDLRMSYLAIQKAIQEKKR